MKPDVEGEYVESVIQRQVAPPRPLPEGSLFRLYFLSPNSRYSIFVGFFFMAGVGMLFFFKSQRVPYSNTTSGNIALMGVVLVSLFAFAFPLVNAHRVRRAIRLGVVTIGKVDGVQDA